MKTGRSFLLTITTVFFLLFSPCVALASQVNIADMTVTPSSAPQAGIPLTVTVNASSSDGSPVYYKFYYCANYGTSAYTTTPWTIVQDYSTSNTAQYTFNQAGKYIIVVRAVTDPNNEPAALPIVGHVVDVGGTNDVTLTGLSRNPTTSVTAGETVQFTANAVNYLNDVIYYKFYYCANYGTDTYATTPWTMMQDYSTLNTCDYTFPSAGDYIVVVRAVTDPNNEPVALPIVGQTVTVTSSATPSCTYSISPASGSFTSGGGSLSVSVTTSKTDCAWTTSETLDWVSLSPTSGTGSKAVTISVSANTGTARTGSITIAGQTFTISQPASVWADNSVFFGSFRATLYDSCGGQETVSLTIGNDDARKSEPFYLYLPLTGNSTYSYNKGNGPQTMHLTVSGNTIVMDNSGTYDYDFTKSWSTHLSYTFSNNYNDFTGSGTYSDDDPGYDDCIGPLVITGTRILNN